MSNLQILEALCGLVETLIHIVKSLAVKLEQLEALEEAERREIDTALDRYSEICETRREPDFLHRRNER